MGAGTAWELTATATYTSKSMSVAGEATVPRGMAFSANGTKAYVMGNASDTIYQYTLSTAWDISTGTYASKSLSATTQDTEPVNIKLSSDGTKAYVVGITNKTIYQYTLSTAWDISTGTYASKSLSVNAEDTSPFGVFFSADGTKAYVVGITNDTIYQYTLSTAWDISTGSYASKSLSVATQDGTPYNVWLSSDGTKAYIVGFTNKTIYQYTLSTAWDISTGSYASKSLSVNAEDTSPLGMGFSADGTKCYMVGNINDKIFQYTLLTYDLTGTVTDPSGTAIASAAVTILNTTTATDVMDQEVTADGSGVYTATVFSNTDTYQAVSSAVGPPRRFGASDNNLTAT